MVCSDYFQPVGGRSRSQRYNRTRFSITQHYGKKTSHPLERWSTPATRQRQCPLVDRPIRSE